MMESNPIRSAVGYPCMAHTGCGEVCYLGLAIDAGVKEFSHQSFRQLSPRRARSPFYRGLSGKLDNAL